MLFLLTMKLFVYLGDSFGSVRSLPPIFWSGSPLRLLICNETFLSNFTHSNCCHISSILDCNGTKLYCSGTHANNLKSWYFCEFSQRLPYNNIRYSTLIVQDEFYSKAKRICIHANRNSLLRAIVEFGAWRELHKIVQNSLPQPANKCQLSLEVPTVYLCHWGSEMRASLLVTLWQERIVKVEAAVFAACLGYLPVCLLETVKYVSSSHL